MRRNHIILLALLLVLQAVPYLAAQYRWGSEWVFGGFLLNPTDGNTYLAKMQSGWAGEWRFYLQYSPDGGAGAFLFLFYLFLGHLARWFSLPLLVVFHTARMLSILALFFAILRLCGKVFYEDSRTGDFALWLVMLGSGMGWAAAIAGWGMTGDFWIAEAYPFLSMFANPHFPLGLAILIWIVTMDWQSPSIWHAVLMAGLGLLLAIVQPFGVVILAGVLLGQLIWHWMQEHRLAPNKIVWALSLGGPFLVYQFLAIRSDAVLAQWDAQNLTLALAGWDLTLSLLPGLAFALVGGWVYWKRSGGSIFMLVFWLGIAVLLVYLPFNLQRRFMTGIYVPTALLAAAGAGWVTGRLRSVGRWTFPVLLGLSVLTNLLILLSSVIASAGLVDGQPMRELFLSRAEVRSMNWLRANTPRGTVVLADTEMGLLIPAWSGRRVVYGHPYESIHAEEQKAAVGAYYEGRLSAEETARFIQSNHIAYIFVRAANLDEGANLILPNNKIYDVDGIAIFQVLP